MCGADNTQTLPDQMGRVPNFRTLPGALPALSRPSTKMRMTQQALIAKMPPKQLRQSPPPPAHIASKLALRNTDNKTKAMGRTGQNAQFSHATALAAGVFLPLSLLGAI